MKWENKQVEDQVWKKGNRALQAKCNLSSPWPLELIIHVIFQISHLNNRPLRVIRGSGLNSPYAPAKGYIFNSFFLYLAPFHGNNFYQRYRYDGLYSVRTVRDPF